MIDVDVPLYVEYDDDSREPVALIETAIDIGQDHKTATVTVNLARRRPILPAFCLLYTLSAHTNPSDESVMDIASFRAKRLYPGPEKAWRIMTPAEWAWTLLAMRRWSARKLDVKWQQGVVDADVAVPENLIAPAKPIWTPELSKWLADYESASGVA